MVLRIKFREWDGDVKTHTSTSYHNANHGRSPLSPVIYRPLATALSRGETRDKFSIYVPRNDSNQSPTHLGSFSQAADDETACEIDERARFG